MRTDSITVDEVLRWRPCEPYPPERVKHFIGEGKTPYQCLTDCVEAGLPVRSALWLVCRTQVMTEDEMRLMAVRIMLAYTGGTAPAVAYAGYVRGWVAGRLTREQLLVNVAPLLPSAVRSTLLVNLSYQSIRQAINAKAVSPGLGACLAILLEDIQKALANVARAARSSDIGVGFEVIKSVVSGAVDLSADLL